MEQKICFMLKILWELSTTCSQYLVRHCLLGNPLYQPEDAIKICTAIFDTEQIIFAFEQIAFKCIFLLDFGAALFCHFISLSDGVSGFTKLILSWLLSRSKFG